MHKVSKKSVEPFLWVMGFWLMENIQQGKKKRERKMVGLRNKKIKSSPIFCLSARVTVRGTYFISGTANQTQKFRAVLKVYSSLNFPSIYFLL